MRYRYLAVLPLAFLLAACPDPYDHFEYRAVRGAQMANDIARDSLAIDAPCSGDEPGYDQREFYIDSETEYEQYSGGRRRNRGSFGFSRGEARFDHEVDAERSIVCPEERHTPVRRSQTPARIIFE